VHDQTTKMIERPVQGDAPERLRAWRGDRSQSDAGRDLGISQAHYNNLEMGKKYPGYGIMKAVSDVAGVPIEAWGQSPWQRRGVRPGNSI